MNRIPINKKWGQKPPLGTRIKTNHPLARGLVGLWVMNEGRGGYLYDLSGNENKGTLTNSPVWTPSLLLVRNRYSLSFNGTNSYVSANNIPAINGATKMTMSMWFKRAATSGYGGFLGQGAAGAREEIQIWNDGIVYMTFTSSDYGGIASNDTLWHHLTVIYDGSQSGNAARLKMYLDGVQKTVTFAGTIPSTTPSAAGNFLLGEDSRGTVWGAGYMDDVRVYNRALSATEIMSLYTKPYDIFTSPNVPVISVSGAVSSILKYIGVAQASIGKANSVAAASIKKIEGVTF